MWSQELEKHCLWLQPAALALGHGENVIVSVSPVRRSQPTTTLVLFRVRDMTNTLMVCEKNHSTQ